MQTYLWVEPPAPPIETSSHAVESSSHAVSHQSMPSFLMSARASTHSMIGGASQVGAGAHAMLCIASVPHAPWPVLAKLLSLARSQSSLYHTSQAFARPRVKAHALGLHIMR